MTGERRLPPAGWYADPDDAHRWRWWEGRRWTDNTRPGAGALGVWALESSASYKLGAAIRAVSATGLATASAVVLYTFVALRPVPGAGVLIVPAFPVLFISQLWVIAVVGARQPPRSDGGRRWGRIRRIALARGAHDVPFGGLGRPAAAFFTTVAVLGMLVAMTAWPLFPHGGPAPARPGCAYPLENHGAITCVSHAAYVRAGAGEQRFVAGILAGFFAGHCGVAASELCRRARRTDCGLDAERPPSAPYG